MKRVIIQGRLMNKLDIANMFFENPNYNIEGLKIWAMDGNKQIILKRDDFKNIYYN